MRVHIPSARFPSSMVHLTLQTPFVPAARSVQSPGQPSNTIPSDTER